MLSCEGIFPMLFVNTLNPCLQTDKREKAASSRCSMLGKQAIFPRNALQSSLDSEDVQGCDVPGSLMLRDLVVTSI